MIGRYSRLYSGHSVGSTGPLHCPCVLDINETSRASGSSRQQARNSQGAGPGRGGECRDGERVVVVLERHEAPARGPRVSDPLNVRSTVRIKHPEARNRDARTRINDRPALGVRRIASLLPIPFPVRSLTGVRDTAVSTVPSTPVGGRGSPDALTLHRRPDAPPTPRRRGRHGTIDDVRALLSTLRVYNSL